jgi:hypothetical protein
MLLCTVGAILVFLTLWIMTAIRIVPEHRRLQVYRLGRYLGEKGPGLVLLLPAIDRGVMVDLQPKLQQAQTLASTPGAVIGQAVTAIFPEGTVELNGARWDAVSLKPIAMGTKVRVRRVLLEVQDMSEPPA